MSLQTQGPAYPQNRRVWNTTDLAAGIQARSGFDWEERPGLVAQDAPIQFGAFCELVNTAGALTVKKFSSGATAALSVALQGTPQGSSDYDNYQYAQGDLVPTLRKGYVNVKIDPNNKPTPGNTFKISYASGLEGYITSSASNSKSVAATDGLEIMSVGDTTCEVYVPGWNAYPVT